MAGPLISAVMPTYNRRQYIPAAIRCFLAQTYSNKELVIVDNGTDHVEDLIPAGVRYEHVGSLKLSTGEMRNRACALSTGPIICHWDDDDWSHPKRMAEQRKLMMSMSVSLAGYNRMYFIDEEKGRAWEYSNPDAYALGTSLMYTREYWKTGKFPDKSVGEDTMFIGRAVKRRALAAMAAGDRLIARIHKDNTCDKTQWLGMSPMYTEIPFASVYRLMQVSA